MKLPVWLSAAYAFTNGMAKTETPHALTPLLCIQNSILWCATLFICNINGERWHEMGVPVYKSPGSIDICEGNIYFDYIKQRENPTHKGNETMKIQVLVCDDDLAFVDKAAQKIDECLRSEGVNAAITKCSDPGKLTGTDLLRFDVMFLDVDMGTVNGIDVARETRKLHGDALIIFLTRFVEFSLEGYEVNAFRYLLKDNFEMRLSAYIKDALKALAQKRDSFVFLVNGEECVVKYQDIVYLESQLRMMCLHTADQTRENRFYATMEEMENELAPAGFLRIQKSYLVNMRCIKKLNYNQVLLTDGTTLPVSQKKYAEIKLQYMNWKTRQ